MKLKFKSINKSILILLAVLIIYLFFANQIVLKFFVNENIAIKTNNLKELTSTSDFYFGLDSFKYYESSFDYCEIAGYSVCEADYEDENKKVDLMFVSDKHTYTVPTNLIPRNDIKRSFSEVTVPTNELGFRSYFSTLSMKNGIYELFLYDVENKESFAYESTGRFFKKDGKLFEEYILPAQEVKIQGINNSNNNNLNSYMSDILVNNNKLLVSGWAYIPEVNSHDSDIYLSVTDGDTTHYYRTQSYSSTGIGYTFKDSNYDWCRFQTELNMNQFESKNLTFGLVVVNGENIGVNSNIKNYEIVEVEE